MTTILKRDYRAVFVAFALTFLSLSGCAHQSPSGATMVIQGPANDTVSWTAIQNPLSPSCSCPSNLCKSGGTVTLPVGANGQAQSPPISPVVDDSVVEILGSSPTPCMGGGFIPECPNPTTPEPVTCNAMNLSAAGGNVTVAGRERSVCRDRFGHLTSPPCNDPDSTEIFNAGTVSVTFDGQTVSAPYNQGSTAFNVAFQLSQAIEQNSTLGSQLMSAANGPLIYVNAINSGTQYDYPWTSSCTYLTRYFSQCSFSAGLSPAASLASPPPHP